MYELDLDILNMYRLAKNKKFLGEVIRARTRQADRPMCTDRQTDRQTERQTRPEEIIITVALADGKHYFAQCSSRITITTIEIIIITMRLFL